jgi:hypothetical protein
MLIQSQKSYFTFCCPSTWWQPQQLISYVHQAKRLNKCRNAVFFLQCVPLATEPGISLIILPLMRILGALQTRTTHTFLFISHTTKVLLFKFRCNIFIGVWIIKEMPASVASGTPCISYYASKNYSTKTRIHSLDEIPDTTPYCTGVYAIHMGMWGSW